MNVYPSIAASVLVSVVSLGTLLGAGWPAQPGQSVPDTKPGGTPKPGEDPKADPAQQAQQVWLAAARPGVQHKMLEPLAGTWTAKGKMFMAPGSPPEETTGTMVQSMIHGNRYLRQEYSGTAMGAPMTGSGLFGYDNNSGKWVGSWVDSMGTGLLRTTGSYVDRSKTWTMTGEMTAPGNAVIKVRQVIALKDSSTIVFEMYMTMPGAAEFKANEVTYTRPK